VLDEIREAAGTIPGGSITVEKESSGPPTGKPVQIEISGEDFDELIVTANRFKALLDSIQIPGIEELDLDLETGKPEVRLNINRDRATAYGLSTGQIGTLMRTAINGNEVSKFRDGEDQYPIVVRLDERYRQDLGAMRNLLITFMDQKGGGLKQIPAAAVADFDYTETVGGVRRKELKRVITIGSNVLDGYNANQINQRIRELIEQFNAPAGVAFKQGGEQEDQQETTEFLGGAMVTALLLILLILVILFNSIGQTMIILLQVLFSVIGVLLGFALTGMTISIAFTGVGIVALAGIVVNNGILLLEFTNQLKKEGWRTRPAIVEAGKIRLKPVLLTATSTILGLVPLAIGLNMDFSTLFTDLDPNIFFGGDSAAFWGPLSWTIIFGLIFATLLTLVVVPALYLIYYRGKIRWARRLHRVRLRLKKLDEKGRKPNAEPAVLD